MANTLKKMMKQHKKKKLAAERARLARLQGKPAGNHQDDYAARLSRHKRNVLKKTVFTVAVIVAAITGITFYVEKRSYHNYKVVQSSEQEDVVSTSYLEMDGDILR